MGLEWYCPVVLKLPGLPMEHIAVYRQQLLKALRGLSELPADATADLPDAVQASVQMLRDGGATFLTALDDHARMEFLIDPEAPVDVQLPQAVVDACIAENPDMPLRVMIDRARTYVASPEYLATLEREPLASASDE